MTTTIPHSHWTLEDTLTRGRKAAALYDLHAAVLSAVLPAGFIDTLNHDRATLGDTTALGALREQKVATAAHHDVATNGHDLVLRVRAVVAKEHPTEAIKSVLGIGDNLGADEPLKVRAALEAIATHGPDLFAHGVPATVVAEAATIAATLAAKHGEQSTAVVHRHHTTTAREAAHLRIEHAVQQLSNRGALAFRLDPVVRAELLALPTHTEPATPAADPVTLPAPAPAPATPAGPDPAASH